MTRFSHSRIVLAPLALLLLAAKPTLPPVPPPALATSVALEDVPAMLDGGKVPEAMAALDRLRLAADLPADRARIDLLRSVGQARQGQVPAAREAIEAAYAATAEPSQLLLRQLFLLRAFTGDVDGAAQALQLVAGTNPKWLKDLPWPVVSDVLRSLAQANPARQFDVVYTLLGAGYAPAEAGLTGLDQLRMMVITGLANQQRLDDAQPFIDALLSTTSIAQLAIDRRFQPIWPALEARLGPGADKADDAYVTAAKAAFDAAPTSMKARLGYAEALNIASHEDEALKVLDIAKTDAELAALADEDLWAINLQAMLLADTGQPAAALKRYAQLAALPRDGRPSLAGIMVNRALLAQGLGEADQAIAIVQAMRGQSGLNENGQDYLNAVVVCANVQTNQVAAADIVGAPRLLAANPPAGVNQAARRAALICRQRWDLAAASIIRALNDPDERMDMLFELQPFLIDDRPTARDRRERAGLRLLKARPDVKAAFLKWGRDLPAAVAPPR